MYTHTPKNTHRCEETLANRRSFRENARKQDVGSEGWPVVSCLYTVGPGGGGGGGGWVRILITRNWPDPTHAYARKVGRVLSGKLKGLKEALPEISRNSLGFSSPSPPPPPSSAPFHLGRGYWLLKQAEKDRKK